jgi:5'-methylthioadenosine phosphorylase
MKPGAVIILDQIIDMTSGRDATFYDEHEVVHIDFTEPFCPDLRKALIDAASAAGTEVKKQGTYIVVNGPRLETAAEIRAFAGLGADVVGMTGMPEAVLARELEICFAGLAVVTNAAAGMTEGKLTATEVIEMMKVSTEQIKSLLSVFFSLDFNRPACSCGTSLKHAKV